MRWPNFAGGSVAARSLLAADEISVNVWPCSLSSPTAKAPKALYGAPGSTLYADLLAGPVRALLAEAGRCFAVAGDGFFELLAPALFVRRGSVALDTAPASLIPNVTGGLELLILSGGRGYTFDLQTNVFAAITDADFQPNAVMGGFLDGYGIYLASSGTFYLSSLNDFTAWDAADAGTRSQASDRVRALLVDPTKLWIFGEYTSEPWYDTGASDFPFAPVPEAFLDVGIAARHSVALVGGTPCWFGQTRGGGRAVYMAPSEAQATVISDAIAPELERYTTVSDAYGWEEVWDGHPMYLLTFPTHQRTWAFDLKEQQIHQRGLWVNGDWQAWRTRCHCVWNGVHLAGSRTDGRVFEQSLETYTDAGDDLRWVRQPARIWDENQRLFHRAIELHTEPGLGQLPPGVVDPTVDLQWSNDGGRTWANVVTASLGRQGEYQARVQWHRLGSARDRVYRFSGTSPVKRAFLDASLEVIRGVAA